MTSPAFSLVNDPSAYDLVPYESYPFPHLHPARIAATARLMGYVPPEVRTARVLDIGCGSGGHLIALAGYYPQMQLLGVDLAAGQVALGMQRIQELGLSNVSLYAGDLTQGLPKGAWDALQTMGGQFDFIVCQGVYYVVPDAVRAVIWALIREHLSARGIAHVSFNTYPGWKHREVAQDFAQFHAGDPRARADASEQESVVRQGLQALASALPPVNHGLCVGYADSLRAEANAASRAVPGLLFHEFLSGTNRPLYFLEMVEQARAAGLAYLCESSLPEAWSGRLGPASERLSELAGGDALRLEQYIDFFTARTYRNSLWIRPDNVPELQQPWALQALEDLSLAADLSLVADDPESGKSTMVSRLGVEFSFDRSHRAAMQALLMGAPGSLWVSARTWLAAHPESAVLLRDCVLHGLISVWVQPPEPTRRVPTWLKAEASRVSSSYLPSAWLEPVRLSPEDREILAQADAQDFAAAHFEHDSRLAQRLPYFRRQGWLL